MERLTERERMLAGLPYSAADPELVAARHRARAALRRLDGLPPEDESAREAALRALLGALGPGSQVMPGLRCDYGAQIHLGAGCFVNFDAVFLDPAPILLGDRVQVAPRVQLLTATHPLDAAGRASGLESARPILIGDDAWLGGGCVVLPGVSVGAGTVVGAGAVVTRDLPAGVLALGNPARVVRRLR